MPNARIYHVLERRDGLWELVRAGFPYLAIVHTTKQAAIERAKEIVGAHKPSHLIVHKPDGSFDWGQIAVRF